MAQHLHLEVDEPPFRDEVSLSYQPMEELPAILARIAADLRALRDKLEGVSPERRGYGIRSWGRKES